MLDASLNIRGARGKAQVTGFIKSLRRDIEAAPIVFVALGYGVGAALYFNYGDEPQLSDVSIATVLGVCGGAVWLRRDDLSVLHGLMYDLLRILVVVIPAICLGFIYTTIFMRSLETQFISRPFYGAISGTVRYIDQSGTGHPRFHLTQVQDHRRDRIISSTVRISAQENHLKFYQPKVGDRITTTAYLMPPSGPSEPDGFDFRLYAYAKQVAAIGTIRGPIMNVGRDPPWVFQRISDAIADRFERNLPAAEAAFAKAIFAGQRQDLPQDVLRAMRETNLAHLLAISGLHVGLIAGFVFFAARMGSNCIPYMRHRMNGKKFGAAVVMVALIVYLLVTGASISTQRAVCMALVALVAIMLDLRVLSLRTIAVAFLMVITLDPHAVTSVGFQMSFSATAALIVVYQQGKLVQTGLRGYLMALCVTTLVAGLATAPFVAYHFNMMSKLGFIANLFAVPLMGMLIVPLGLLSLIEDFVIGSGLVYVPLRYAIHALFYIGKTAAELQGAPIGISTPPVWVFSGMIAAMIGAVSLTQTPQRVSLICVIVFLAIWARSERPVALVYEEWVAYLPEAAETRQVYPAKGNSFMRRSWLQRDGFLDNSRGQEWDGDPPQNAVAFCHSLGLAQCERLTHEAGPFALYRHSIVSAQQRIGDRLWVNTSE